MNAGELAMSFLKPLQYQALGEDVTKKGPTYGLDVAGRGGSACQLQIQGSCATCHQTGTRELEK